MAGSIDESGLMDNKQYYIILILASLISTIFWTAYASQKYMTFGDAFYDIGNALQGLNNIVNHSTAVSGLQYFVFGNHIAITGWLFTVPFFYLWQSPYMLFLLQAAILSFTSVLVFFVGKEVTKSNTMSFVLGLAYLVNPGMQGMLYFDFHVEFLIIPLALTTFYFYIKLDKKMFYLSLLVLLLLVDTMVFVVGALGLGLLYYELFYDKKPEIKKERIKLALAIIFGTMLALAFYLAYYSALLPMYSTTYADLPVYEYATPFDFITLNNLLHGLIPISSPLWSSAFYNWPGFVTGNLDLITVIFIAGSVLIGILAFGFGVLADPILTVLLTAPWFVEVVLLRHKLFGVLELQYFSYVIAGSVIAAILGMVIIRENKGLYNILGLNKKLNQSNGKIMLYTLVLLSCLVIFLGLVLRPPINPPVNSTCISELNNVIGKVPANSSLMTMPFIAPHVSNRVQLELMYDSLTQAYVSFKPDYILSDFNTCFPLALQGDNYTFNYFFTNISYSDNMTSISGYHLIAKNGTAELWMANG